MRMLIAPLALLTTLGLAGAAPSLAGELRPDQTLGERGQTQSEPVTLEYTYRQGAPLRYKVTSSSSMIQHAMGQTVTVRDRSTTVLTRELAHKRDDGSLVIAQTPESYKNSETSPAGEFTFDSTSEEDKPKGDDPRVKADVTSLGWRTELVISPRGRITGVANSDELTERIAKVSDPQTRAQLEETFTLESLTREYGPFMFVLPEKPVGVGDSWEQSFTVSEDGMAMTANQTMTVKSIADWKDGSRVRVEFNGKLDMQLPPEFPAFMKVSAKSIKGHYVFSTHEGAMSEYHATIHFRFEGSPGEGAPPMSVDVALDMQYALQGE